MHTNAYKSIQMHTNAYKTVSSDQLGQIRANPALSQPWPQPTGTPQSQTTSTPTGTPQPTGTSTSTPQSQPTSTPTGTPQSQLTSSPAPLSSADRFPDRFKAAVSAPRANRPIVSTVTRFGNQPRGGLVELRIHGCDPDRAEQQARQRGYQVVQAAADKPHGLREAYLRDAEGYLWVPDRSIASTSS